MFTFRTSFDVTADRQVVVTLPPDTPIGKAELVVTVDSQISESSEPGKLRRWFGTAHTGDPRSADNPQIDADLARAYGDSHE